MAYSNPNVELTYIGDGVISNFSVNFDYAEGETAVISTELWDFTDPLLPVQQAFVLGVDYTIDESAFPATEVNTTAPPAVNFKLIIYRATSAIQGASFANGAFPAESVEEAFDRAVQIGQENKASLERASLTPIGGTSVDITALNAQVATNITDIATNVTDIATNAGGVAANLASVGTNAGNIATNTADVATNLGNIATNTGNIATNTAAIALLGTPTLVIRTLAGAYVASNADIIIVKIAAVTVTLPAPTAGFKVSVKMEGTLASTIVDGGAATLDGAGTTYTLTSDYESKTFIADGTNWFII